MPRERKESWSDDNTGFRDASGDYEPGVAILRSLDTLSLGSFILFNPDDYFADFQQSTSKSGGGWIFTGFYRLNVAHIECN